MIYWIAIHQVMAGEAMIKTSRLIAGFLFQIFFLKYKLEGNGVCVYEYSYQGHVDAIKDLSKREIVTLNEKAVTDLSNVDPKDLLLIRVLCFLNFVGILAGAKRKDESEKE